jgi:predicted ATPase/class 3 adenylate cyclase
MRFLSTRGGGVSYDALIETLTFFFTDIEQSTVLLRHLGDDVYAQVLTDHHQIVRGALLDHGGREEGTQGDAFFAVFTSPSACVLAALEIQRELLTRILPNGENLRVRMGIHTGEVSENSVGLVGYEIHRAARIAAVGHGGQILLSSSSAGLVEGSLASDLALRELGSHRLKDLGRPETIFQLVAEGIEANFPPLRSLDNPELANNLPTSLSPMIGREFEKTEVRRLVVESRLVTLTGAGGSGKTRLALQVAAELLDGSGEGVWFVDLAPISDPGQVPSTALNAMELRQQPDSSPIESLLITLKSQNVLIVFDNCEHVIDSVARLVESIGHACPHVSIVVTSREPLGVAGEQIYRVRSMSLPSEDIDNFADLEGSDAVDLFLARVNSYDSTITFDDDAAPLIASICRRLDGIPLAIELAASRLSSMSLEDLHDRLDQRFRLLTGGSRNALPRQQTLGAMVAWSYDLLDDRERGVLRRLSVFVGGFDLKAAEHVCSSDELESFDVADIVSSLVNKSLVTAERTSTALRYRLLETIRQYAADLLLQIDGDTVAREVRNRHAAHFFELSEGAKKLLKGEEQGLWMRRLDDEWDNVQSAWRHFLDEERDREKVLRFGIDLVPFLSSRLKEAPITWMASVLEGSDDLPTSLRGMALVALVEIILIVDAPKVMARDYLEVALTLARNSENKTLEAEVYGWMAFEARTRGDEEACERLGSMAVDVARSSGDPSTLGEAFLMKGLSSSDFPTSHECYSFALAEFRRQGNLFRVCTALIGLSITGGLFAGDLNESKSLTMEAMEIAEQIGSQFHIRLLLVNLGVTLFLLGEIEESEQFNRRSLFTARRVGLSESVMYWCVFGLACCATKRGDYARGAILIGSHDALRDRLAGGTGYWTPIEIEMREHNRETLIASLGVKEFDRLVDVGRGLSHDQLIDFSLGRKQVG